MTAYQPTDRRPIAARSSRASIAAARWLVKRGASANAISIAGMICCVLAGIALAATTRIESPVVQRLLFLCAAALAQLRLIANMLDGMVAIESATASPMGELYNEIPDRVSDAAALIGLGYAAGGDPTLGFIATILAIFTAYVRVQGKIAGAPGVFAGPMAKPHRMFVVTLAALYCAIAPHSWQPSFRQSQWGLPAIALAIIVAGTAITSIRRLVLIRRALHGT